MKRLLLYVDDEQNNLVVFRAAFQDRFKVFDAKSAQEGLKILEQHEIPVVVADQRMPDMTGVELCEQVKIKHPHTIRMILTAYMDPESMMAAINKGHVYSFITKPWERPALLSILIRGFEAYDLAMSNNALVERLAHTERCTTLGRLAAGIAHEMGNQLLILPLVELIEEKYDAHDDLCELADIAKQTHQRLSTLIEEVKAFVRLERDPGQMHKLQLDQLLRETISFARFDKSMAVGTIDLTITAEPVIKANKIKIQQALLNLGKNAADATRNQDHPHINVRLEQQDDHAVITVEDNGCGIAPHQLARIWEPFFSTKGSGGTGLGLDITRQIVEAHGGSITCTSTLGVGTRFTIRLPLVPANEPCPATSP